MKEISAKELEEKLARGEKLEIIDVREDDEVAMGKIPGAKHIPLGYIPLRLDELDKDTEYYLICRSENRSGVACEYLAEQGYKVTNVTGGMLAWEGDVE